MLNNIDSFFYLKLMLDADEQAIEWYDANNVVMVPKNHNPFNSPELHPNELYWV